MKKLFLVLAVCCFVVNLWAQHGAISVKVTGSGSPLILLPGYACSGEVWNKTVDQLKGQFECHVITYAGNAGIAPVDIPWMVKVEDAIVAYIAKNKLKKPKVMGHSIGATFGIALCAKNSDLFSKLIIVDELPCIGMVMFPNFTSDMITFDNPYNQKLLNMDEVAFKGMVSQMANGMCREKEKQNLISDWMVKADRKTYVYGYTELLKTDLRKELTLVKVPTLILASTLYPSKDQIEKNYTEQYTNLQNKSIVYVEGAAHFIMFDQPEIFIREVTHFLSNSAVSDLNVSPKN